MPTRVTKGNHGHPDRGSKESGNQKAVFGSGVSPEVSEEQSKAAVGEGPWEEETSDKKS